jgi:hypothetical protein
MKTFVLTVMVSVMSVLVSIAVTAVSTGYTPKYRVKVQADKRTDFSKLRTYSWMPGHPASIESVDDMIVAAIERELTILGMQQVRSGDPTDVVVTYASVTRTDVNVKGKPAAGGARPEYAVGTLVVSLLDPESLRPLLQLRIDRPVAPSGLDAAIGRMVQEMFTYFPTRRK